MRFSFGVLALTLVSASAAPITQTLFGGNGGHPNPDGSPLSINNGWLETISQTTGAVTLVGHPAGVAKLSGIAFLNSGVLYGSTINSISGFPPPLPTDPTSDLVRINPSTGALIQDIGTITAGGNPLHISDLAFNPLTGVLYAINATSSLTSPVSPDNLYTINTTTGVATLVGNLGDFFGNLTFAPNGTLYVSSADLDNMGNIVNPELKTVNPANAAMLTMVPTAQFYEALAIRADGTIFAANGDGFGDPLGSALYTVNPTTGSQTLVGHPGLDFVGGLAFQPVPEPMTLGLCGLGLLGLAAYRRVRTRG